MILCVARMGEHTATPARLGRIMWAARESVPAHKEESVLRSTTPSVERMEEHTATPVRLGKEMLSAQGSAPANQVYKSM